ncbi:TPR-like protein [Annulohypoxylon maeteangense]|uniref:TPR-like protein n=1 Tax=Annulohypoxylon maeteangense TaxID=1927788 RepID=UPI0020076408|nr:TPR-like protein [Annulohypoxylon maeteangense]KAI0886308.1 TPR-like protein [Annulohypoxylon maeteangense]
MVEPGLHILFDSGKDSPDRGVVEIDIVAVHGLNFRNNPDHARDTWKANDTLWLKDFLPNELAKPARVMLFSYNSSPAIDAAATKLADHAKSLLQWLHIERKDSPQRPLVFICHSLGGLVVKEALVEAALDVTYKSIAEETRLLVFFATPHRGGNGVGIGEIVAKIVRAGLRKPKNDLLDALKKNSDSATKRFEQSRHVYERCLVVNFFEGRSYGKLGIIVDRDSATLGLPGAREKQLPTDADHSTICKFDSVDTRACQLVLRTIVTEVDRALEIELRYPACFPGNVHWLVPRSVNALFTGRQKIITKIKNAVIPSTAPSVQKRFILTGMGGQGKSEICLKVADELREKFWGVFWVDVSSDSTAKAGFSKIGKMLKSGEAEIDEVRGLLSNIDPKRPWLLILDNADNPKVDYNQYCPSGARGTVLITSRNPECQRYATVGHEDLGSLDNKDCINLLLQSMQLTIAESSTINSDAERVIEVLGSHTLAILQAGAYIATGICTLSEYPGVFQKQNEQVLKFNLTQDQSRYRNVFATLEASAEILDPPQSANAEDSLYLLRALSPLHYENVPLGLFAGAWQGAQYVGKYLEYDESERLTNEHVSQLPDFLECHSHTWDQSRLLKAANLLESLALIRKSGDGDQLTISMHPLIHSWINLRQEPAQEEESLRMAQCIIALSQYYQPDWQPYRNRIGVHVLSVLQRSSLTHGWERHLLVPVYVHIAWLLHELRYDQKLEELLRYIFTKLRLDPDNPSEQFLSIFDIAATNANYRGKIARSIKISTFLLRIQEKTLNETHPDRLSSQHGLACAYVKNGQIEEAIDLFQQIVKIRETTHNETHPDRLSSQHGLACAYVKNGQIEEAIDLFQQVIQIRETTLNKTHPNRLASQYGLACAYLKNGQIEEAIDLFQQVVKIQEITLDETHPDRLASQHGLACAYLPENGQVEEAIDLFQQVVKIQEITLDETHPDRLASQHELARAYLENEQIEKAIDLFQQVVKIRETTLHETHPDRLASQHELARAYLENGQVEEAIDLFQQVVKIRETTLNETHPSRLISQRSLAYALQVYAERDQRHSSSESNTSEEQRVPQKAKRQRLRRFLSHGLRRIVGRRNVNVAPISEQEDEGGGEVDS